MDKYTAVLLIKRQFRERVRVDLEKVPLLIIHGSRVKWRCGYASDIVAEKPPGKALLENDCRSAITTGRKNHADAKGSDGTRPCGYFAYAVDNRLRHLFGCLDCEML
jgi:hypothetical protein